MTAKSQPLLVKYQDEDGNIRMKVIKDSRRYFDESAETSEESRSVHLHEHSRRGNSNEDSDSDLSQYYNSEEENKSAETYKESEEHREDDNESVERSPKKKFSHPYVESDLSSASSEKLESSEVEQAAKPRRKSCKKCSKPKKNVYVYKQPPIVVRPKPTNVYIKSKPIVIQPPPLVVHHPAQKPCNPIIKYQPPNIKLKPVIVKISKPRKTTPETTTKKPCKCRRKSTKPTKKCSRCNRHKTVYYNQHKYQSSEPATYVQYKNKKCSGKVET